MKTPRTSHGKKFPSIIILTLLTLSALTALNVSMTGVSAAQYPSIYVEPAEIIDPTMTPGTNFTVEIKTDYNGSDIWGWQFELEYNPNVLHVGLNTTDIWTGDGSTKKFTTSQTPVAWRSEKVYVNQTLMTRDENYTITYDKGEITFTVAPASGVEVKATYLGDGVVNGGLISGGTATFIPPLTINNTAGTISLTSAFFFYIFPPIPTTSGPGTLANVTFTVVGTGDSNITLGPNTQLQGSDGTTTYIIINGKFEPDHLGHGYFSNVPNIHDVAITELIVPATAILGDVVSIDMTVANEGNYTEIFNVTVYANTTLIGSKTNVTLTTANRTTQITFNWNTTSFTTGTYIINATATVDKDNDPNDNKATAPLELKAIHDVAVITLEVPPEALLGDTISINVTVANKGHFKENVTLTVSYYPSETTPLSPYSGVIDTANFTLNSGLSELFFFNWTITDLPPLTQYDKYTINATATIALDDEYPDDNTNTTEITLKLGHDVRVIQPITAPKTVFVGELVPISATVENVGGFEETFNVTAYYDSVLIETKSVTLAAGANTTLDFEWNTTDVPPADYVVKVEAILDGDADPTNNKGNAIVILKSPLGNVAGTVTDASTGNPIEGANVTANGYFAITDVAGHYNITDLPAGIYNVTASANGYETSSKTGITVVSSTTAHINFTLTPLPGTINGTVRDSSTNDPIAGATVTVNGMSATTDSSGAYTISNVPAGTYNITVSADGYQTSSKTGITVDAGETTTVDFELKPIRQTNFLLYGGVAVAIIIIAGIAVYMLKVRKPT